MARKTAPGFSAGNFIPPGGNPGHGLARLSVMNESVMDEVAPGYLRQRAALTKGHVYENCMALAWIATHPRELARHPEWLRQRTAATIALRAPWWPYDAVAWVAAHLPPEPRVFEYGSGGSTLWLEDLGADVTSVEDDAQWHKQSAAALRPGTRLLFQPPQRSGVASDFFGPGFFDTYVAAIDGEQDGSLDLVIIDGRARIECVHRAMTKVKPDGLLLFDDTDFSQFQSVVALLQAWERHVFVGLKPGQRAPAQTSVWRRPANG